MDIIAKNAPLIDPARLDQSLEEFRNYMVEVLQLIDFTLSNQKNRINGAVSEENFLQLAAALQALKSEVASQGSAVVEWKSAMETMSNTLQSLSGEIDSLEERVAALEGAS